MSLIDLPYNHIDGPRERQPLPLRCGTLPGLDETAVTEMTTVWATVRSANDQDVHLRLVTDSRHLAHLFALNWGGRMPVESRIDAQIVARRGRAAEYGLPDDFDTARQYCHETRQVWITGSEFYGNVKITVRGICSALAPATEIFVHGCAMEIGGKGIILSGTSGAGKTTLTAAIVSASRQQVRVVNDDWGSLSLTTLRFRYTGEGCLHMKYPSVNTLAPALDPSPGTHASENFRGDRRDPHARLMIRREEVFGSAGIADDAALSLFVVVFRDTTRPASIRVLDSRDLDAIERGQYSDFYSRTEFFLNGSLFLASAESLDAQRGLHDRLLRTGRCVVVNNGGRPEVAAALILKAIDDAATRG